MKKTMYFFLGCLVFYSCETNVEEEAEDIVNSSCDPNISFNTDIKPIIDSNCISCHNGSQFPDLRSFNGISNNAQRVRNQVVSRRMPLGGSLTDQEIELIDCWIENGALNN